MIKRFGLPMLVSAVYISAMILIFSTDYSQEYSFLYPTDGEETSTFDGEGMPFVHPTESLGSDEGNTTSDAIPLETASENSPQAETVMEVEQPQGPSPEGSDEE